MDDNYSLLLSPKYTVSEGMKNNCLMLHHVQHKSHMIILDHYFAVYTFCPR